MGEEGLIAAENSSLSLSGALKAIHRPIQRRSNFPDQRPTPPLLGRSLSGVNFVFSGKDRFYKPLIRFHLSCLVSGGSV